MFYAASKFFFMLLRPSNAVIIAMLLGLILRKSRRLRQVGRVLLGGGFLVLVLASWSGLSIALIYPLEQRFPQIDPPKQPPSGILILGGVVDSQLATERAIELTDGAERLIAAAELARLYPETRIIFTGGSDNLSESELPEAEIGANWLASLGVDRARIVVENKSRNTRENATMSYDLVQPGPDETFLLVTSAYHMPRAMGVFRAAGWTGLTAYPVDYRTDGPPGVLANHAASQSLFLTDLAVKEWLGLLTYRFAGYTEALFPAE